MWCRPGEGCSSGRKVARTVHVRPSRNCCQGHRPPCAPRRLGHYTKTSNQPLRWLAQGRDASATIDSANAGFGKNDQDNEITGVHVSDGDPGTKGVLGAREPNLFKDGWRWFYTQQHGDKLTCEVIPASGGRTSGGDEG
jgi:hypothetical protein